MREIQLLDEFDQLLSSAAAQDKLVVVDFYATWCGPCVRLAPLYEELSKRYSSDDIIFVKVNADENRELCTREQIRALPTFKIFRSRKCIAATSGMVTHGFKPPPFRWAHRKNREADRNHIL